MASAVDQARGVGDLNAEVSAPSASVTDSMQPQPSRSSGDIQTSDDEDLPHDMVSSTLSNSSVASPPYWLASGNHQRSVSAESILPVGAITLQDNDTSEHDDRNNACWAKSVEIVDYTIVNGGATSVGAFVVWNVRVETLNVCLKIRSSLNRYSPAYFG